MKFYNENGEILPELFDTVAKDYAKSFASSSSNKDGSLRWEGVTKTQLRRFFDEVKRFEQILPNSTWQEQLPFIKMLKSKINYGVARVKSKGNSKGYDKFAEFITEGIDLIKKEKDYHTFVSLFEAVYGFYYETATKIKESQT